MSDDWNCEIETWPQSTGEGHEADQKACGQRIMGYRVRGDSIHEAIEAAEHICTGIKTNPRVWQAQVRRIEYVRRED